jgi:atypical dual specificity phosphatase
MSQWWIDKPKFLGSTNPTDTELEKLYEQGFRIIISLLDETQQLPEYDVKKAEKMGFRRYSIPVRDFKSPTQGQFQEFLDIMKQAEDKVIIHCQGGSGRTGTMGAAYWISKGLPAHSAVKKVKHSNPAAIEEPEQEEACMNLRRTLRCERKQNLAKIFKSPCVVKEKNER